MYAGRTNWLTGQITLRFLFLLLRNSNVSSTRNRQHHRKRRRIRGIAGEIRSRRSERSGSTTLDIVTAAWEATTRSITLRSANIRTWTVTVELEPLANMIYPILWWNIPHWSRSKRLLEQQIRTVHFLRWDKITGLDWGK